VKNDPVLMMDIVAEQADDKTVQQFKLFDFCRKLSLHIFSVLRQFWVFKTDVLDTTVQ